MLLFCEIYCFFLCIYDVIETHKCGHSICFWLSSFVLCSIPCIFCSPSPTLAFPSLPHIMHINLLCVISYISSEITHKYTSKNRLLENYLFGFAPWYWHWVTSKKISNLSMTQFHCFKVKLTGMLWRFSELFHVMCLEKYLVYNEYLILSVSSIIIM